MRYLGHWTIVALHWTTFFFPNVFSEGLCPWSDPFAITPWHTWGIYRFGLQSLLPSGANQDVVLQSCYLCKFPPSPSWEVSLPRLQLIIRIYPLMSSLPETHPLQYSHHKKDAKVETYTKLMINYFSIFSSRTTHKCKQLHPSLISLGQSLWSITSGKSIVC